MTTLNLLTGPQLSSYLAGLNLAQGTEAYQTLNALLLLPTASFAEAISAVAQGLISWADLRALPAMNDTLVGALIASRLSPGAPGTLEWSYLHVWLPASIDLTTLRVSAIGSAAVYVAARAYDFWGMLVTPIYDFIGTNPTAYQSYAEAYGAYMTAVNSGEAADAVAAFVAVHAAFRVAHPELLQTTDAECPILQAILSLLTSAYFLENPATGRAPSEILDMLAVASYRNVAPGLYRQFIRTIALPAMAAAVASDPDNSGLPGAAAVAAAASWGPLPATGIEWAFAQMRMALVWLPSAYGTLVLNTLAIEANWEEEAALVAYLDAARTALVAVQEAIQLNFPQDATAIRTLAGTPIGLLLTITNP
jgi:hypothetical protein